MYNYIQRFYLTTQLTKSVTERACFSAAHSRQNFKIIVRTQTQSRDLSELKVLGIFTIPRKYTCGSALGWHARGRGGRGAGESPGGLALPARGSELASPSRTGGLFASWSQKVQVVADFVLRSLVGIGFPSAKAPIVFLGFVPGRSCDRSKWRGVLRILARLVGRISGTNAIREFGFALSCLLDDLLPDGEECLKIGGCLWERLIGEGVYP